MTRVSADELNIFLAKLEGLRQSGCQYVCVIPFSAEEAKLIAEYSWVTESSDVCAISEHVRDGSMLYVAARNYSLHKYLVRFRIASQSDSIGFAKDPRSQPSSSFEENLIVVPCPPRRNPGDGACKGCKIAVLPTYDPT